jgi:glutamate synthase (NADPH/NADH) small chain
MALAKKERMKIPRQKMPEQKPEVRVNNFDEVPVGFDKETAMREAARCLECRNAKCVSGCPVEIDIPKFISQVAEGDLRGASRTLKEANSLPAICGRVCPQEEQCENTCVVAKRGDAVGIGRLERFVADWERDEGGVELPKVALPTGKRVAIVGSGPAGLTCAGDLCKMGHEVTVFEALHEPGGVLVYGIPEFRLPKKIVRAEVDMLRQMGVDIKTSYIVGRMDTVDELFDELGYDAVFIGTGAGLPTFQNVPGENLNGIFSANEFLTRVNLMKSYMFPRYDTPLAAAKHVAVLGGGNTAMDAVRTSRRLGSEKAMLLYRRTRAEMPAREEEIHHAEQEGVEFQFLVNPVRYIGNDEGWVKEIELIRMELGEPDDSGRRRPVPVEGSEFKIPVDRVIVAIGNKSNPLVQKTTPGLETTRWGTIKADDKTLMTSRPGVFAGGDIVTGGATVILAAGAGKRAARSIDRFVKGLPLTDLTEENGKGDKKKAPKAEAGTGTKPTLKAKKKGKSAAA